MEAPMLSQYYSIKDEHHGEVLFFRLGDFYEMFAEDAIDVSALLNLTLTSRNGLPMCGIPYHAARSYIARLLKHGKKIAICEQTGEMAKKGLIERQVVEVITPGTAVDEDYLEGGDSNYLAALFAGKKSVSFSYIDLSTGAFFSTSFPLAGGSEYLACELERLQIKEIVVQESLFNSDDVLIRAIKNRTSIVIDRWMDWQFDAQRSWQRLLRQFGAPKLHGFGLQEHSPEVVSAGVLLDYIDITAGSLLGHIRSIRRYGDDEFVGIDESSQRNLELIRNLGDGGTKYTLLETLDETKTGMGRRLLINRLLHPLRSIDMIEKRLSMVEIFYRNQAKLAEVRAILAKIQDLERFCSRLAMDRAHGKDLAMAKNALSQFFLLDNAVSGLDLPFESDSLFQNQHRIKPNIVPGALRGWETPAEGVAEGGAKPQAQSGLWLCADRSEGEASPSFSVFSRDREADSDAGGAKTARENALSQLNGLRDLLERALLEEPSILLTEGKLIKHGYDAELDRLHELRDNGRKTLADYLEREKAATGILSLKINYNRIIGYFFEVSNAQLEKVPAYFIRRQGVTGGGRFTTDQLSSLESEINGANDRIVETEKKLFLEVREQAKNVIPEILAAAQKIAETDVAASLAQAATIRCWIKPEVHDRNTIHVLEGRHPVVEAHLPRREFVPNDVILGGGDPPFVLITGPNMAGKSTYLRQCALFVIMAQMGSFIPAAKASIGIVDRIYCRVGAQDNLARGESTFLVEMNETAYILNTASERSLVIMDEVGRGTGTNDGRAIAQAVCEDILNRLKCRTLFATHYHELSLMTHPGMANRSMDIEESGGTIVFKRRLREGASMQSYGIHVARMAGLSEPVLVRAAQIEATLSAKIPNPANLTVRKTSKPVETELPLFL
ncbi:MAG: DNA mismatch repair protein MutS [Spirochaetaceae bacterium]|jgi:DNA mismatch repair protein MutS|nr:DNA mismatch repair protein MutS [Spirochaetaceae bacterium]